MKATLLFGALLMVATIGHADEAEAKKYLASLEGKYTVTSLKRSGEEAPAEFVKNITVTVKGSTLAIAISKEEEKTATLVVDPSQKPVALDFTPKDGPKAGQPMLGIVSLEKGVLKLAWSDDKNAKTRPKDFTSTKEDGQFLFILEKAK